MIKIVTKNYYSLCLIASAIQFESCKYCVWCAEIISYNIRQNLKASGNRVCNVDIIEGFHF